MSNMEASLHAHEVFDQNRPHLIWQGAGTHFPIVGSAHVFAGKVEVDRLLGPRNAVKTGKCRLERGSWRQSL